MAEQAACLEAMVAVRTGLSPAACHGGVETAGGTQVGVR